MKHQIDNFTAVLPVTCNADCHFCPEKEMPNDKKAPRDKYIQELTKAIKTTEHFGYDHVSISGGEPSLVPKLLGSAIDGILDETNIRKIGLTTNAQFLESDNKLNAFFDAITDEHGNCKLTFMNISRHAVRTEDNNEIMGVKYNHTISDIIQFRLLLPVNLSFHINVVVTDDRDLDVMFEEFKVVSEVLKEYNIDVVFRTDYTWHASEFETTKIPTRLQDKFYEYFGSITVISECDTCWTLCSNSHPNMFLKGATFEPTDHEEVARELVFHQDGKLYYDWMRQKPFTDLKILELLGKPTLNLSNKPISTNKIDVVNVTKPNHKDTCEFRATMDCNFNSTRYSACGYTSNGGSCGFGSSSACGW